MKVNILGTEYTIKEATTENEWILRYYNKGNRYRENKRR